MGKPGEHVSIGLISRTLKRKMEAEKLNQTDIARATGISKSTISRLVNCKGMPDAGNVAAICDYLNIPCDRLMNSKPEDVEPVIYYPDESLPEIVEAHLARDKNLTPEDAARLAEIFRAAYGQFAGFEKKLNGGILNE